MTIDDIINAVEMTRMYVKDEPNQTLYLVYSNRTNFTKIVDIFNESDLKRFAEDYLDINSKDFKNIETLIEYIRENGYYVTEFNNNL